ncbi:putative Ig domain-containing protein [Ensifer sp. NPDC090286]|uniref:putative Ig domain-containing protein n=1 Tax=Ensifer sp. NPDC090286 TaxID=3363991 RepID=UPI00383B31F8
MFSSAFLRGAFLSFFATIMLLVSALSASAQSVEISANPTTFNALGDTINFTYVINPGAYTITGVDAATSAIKGVAVSCGPVGSGSSPITCTGSYRVDANDVMSGQLSDFVQFAGSRIGGNGRFSATSPTIVVRAATGGPVVLDVASSPNPSRPGDPVSVTATVSSMGCNAGQSPPGNVTISIGSQSATLGLTPTGPVSASSSATFHPTTLANGEHPVSVTYGGGSGCSTGSATGANHWVDTEPTVTINQATGQADPSAKTAIAFDVVFNKSVTGFTGSDVQLSGTAGATTASVSGSGANYRVTVSGMSQAGTVTASIPAGKARSVAGFLNLASTSSDNTITYEPIVLSPSTLPAPVYNQNYTSADISASGGSGTKTFARTSGALPAGMFLLNDGDLLGIPSASGSFNFTVTATDAEGSTASRAYTVNIAAPAITIGPTTLSDATFGAAYSQALAGAGGASPYRLAVTQGAIPAGLTLASNGTLSGTPTAAGGFTFTVTATDAYGSTGSQVLTLNVAAVAPDAPVIGTAVEGDRAAKVHFSAPPVNGGSAIASYTVTSDPGGFIGTGTSSPIDVTGLTNGTSYTFTVTATNGIGIGPASAASNAVTPKATQTITFANPGSQNYGTSPTLTASASSSLPVSFTSSTTAVCTVGSGGLLAFGSAGTCTISADQTGDGTYLAAVTVTQSFTVNAVSPGAPTGAVATAGDSQASIAFVAPVNTGGAPISRYVVTSSPGGLTGDATSSPVVVAGLTNGMSYTFTVVAENGSTPGPASAASNAVTPRTIQTITFANPGTQNFGTTPTLTATSDSGLTVSFTSSTPAVCTISPGGLLAFASTGTCTVLADQAGDSTYLPAMQTSRSFVVNAVVPDAPTGVVATAGNASAEVAFAAPVNTGGAAITDYTVTASPGGLSKTGPASPLTVSGLSNGTSYTFTVTATNSVGPGAVSAASTAVTPKGPQTISFANPGSQDYATPVSLSASASSGLPVAWQSSTPNVCVVTSGGAVSFRNGGTCTIEVSQAGDSAYLAAPTVSQSFTVSAPIFAFTPAAGALSVATVATAYSESFDASGGTGPYSYSLASGSLPAGLTLDPSGALAGTPTEDGSFTFTVAATDSYGATGTSGSYSLTVRIQAPIANATTATVAANSSANVISPNLTGGTAASVAIVATPSHGTATVAGNTFSYTPAAGFSGADSFTYTATNTTGTSAPATVTVTVSPPTFAFTPAAGALAGATVADAYDLTITAANGTAPYTYAVTGGALPAGVTLAADGRLSGTPTSDGPATFTVTATDANNATGTASYSLAVAVEAPSAGPVGATVAANSSANAISLNLTGGAATSVAIATAPAHGMATVTGTTILYTPAAGYSGADSFTYTATNATGTSAPATVSVTVSPPVLVLTPAGGALANGVPGVSYSQSIAASAGTAPYSYTVSSGALPGGLTLDASSGSISGRPSADGDFGFTVTATDAHGATGQASYRIAVASANIVFTPSPGSLPDAMVGETYSAPISASGGTGALIYSVKSGTLPKGMVLNISTGELTGPVAADAAPDTYGFTIGVVDSRGASGSAAYTLKLNARAVTVPNVVVEVPAGSTPKDVYLNGGATGGPFIDASVASVSPPIAGRAEIIEGELAAAGSFTPVGFYLKFTPNPSYSGSAVVSYTLRSALGASNLGSVTYKIALDRVAAGEEIDGLVRDFVRNRQNMLSSTVKVPGLIERRRAAASTDPVTTTVTPSEKGARLGFSTSLSQIQAARDAADAAAAGGSFAATDQPFDIWMDGSFLFHKDKDDESDKWGNFALFSIGADYLVNERALVGLSFHYDYMSDPTDEDAELKGNGWLAGPYASFEIGQGVFLDANLLYGGSSNDIDTGIFTGTFDTTRWMADVKLTGEWQLDEITVLTPKLRAVYFNEEVDDYTVKNALGETIDLKGFIEEQARFSIGFDVERTLELENGLILSPTIGADVGFASLDGEGLFGRVSAGLALSNNDNWDLDFSLLFNIEGDGSQAAGAKVGARVRF